MKRKIAKTDSTAYQNFTINGSAHIARPTVGCDEYGDTTFFVRLW